MLCAPDAVPRMTLTSPKREHGLHQERVTGREARGRVVRAVRRRDVDHGAEEQAGEGGADELDHDVARHALPREVAAERERERDGWVQMGAGHLAHEQDDPHHHQPGCDDGCGAADRVGERLAHHPAAGGDEDEEEGPEELREQAPPLLARVLEVRRTCRQATVSYRCTRCCSGVLVTMTSPSVYRGSVDVRRRRWQACRRAAVRTVTGAGSSARFGRVICVAVSRGGRHPSCRKGDALSTGRRGTTVGGGGGAP